MKSIWNFLFTNILVRAGSFRSSARSVEKSVQAQIDARWTKESKGDGAARGVRTRWWQSKYIRNHIDRRVFDSEAGSGFLVAAQLQYKVLPAKRGVSVGSGDAGKEISLLHRGLVEHFDLYELSQVRIDQALEKAKKSGVEERVSFHRADPFQENIPDASYDLVYWDNALHHMMDVDNALQWTHRVLKTGGGLLMDDFVGSTRFQWSDKQLNIARRVRQAFEGTSYLSNPRNSSLSLDAVVKRPTIPGMIAADPSEAADSDSIVPCLKKHFPSCTFVPTGGAVYHLVLNDMLANFDESQDTAYLDLMLIIDDLMSELGEYHYGVAFAIKD